MTPSRIGDHRDFLAGLTSDQKRRLTAKSDHPGLRLLFLHFGSIIGLGLMIALNIPFWFLLLPVQGLLLVFLFTLMHEATHKTAFKTGWINLWAARLAGLILFLPPVWFQHFHFAHHRFTQDAGKDPELATPKPTSRSAYLWHITGIRVWLSSVKTLLRNAAGGCRDDYVPASAAPRVVAEARWMLAVYAVSATVGVWAGSDVLIWVWLIPVLIGQPFLRLYLLAEHGGCPHEPNMLANTRTVFTGRLMRLLAWNMPYHAEHHAFPAVPFHRLPDLHALLRPHLLETAPGYRSFTRDFARKVTGGSGGR